MRESRAREKKVIEEKCTMKGESGRESNERETKRTESHELLLLLYQTHSPSAQRLSQSNETRFRQLSRALERQGGGMERENSP